MQKNKEILQKNDDFQQAEEAIFYTSIRKDALQRKASLEKNFFYFASAG